LELSRSKQKAKSLHIENDALFHLAA
jgi:hypothetical protein